MCSRNVKSSMTSIKLSIIAITVVNGEIKPMKGFTSKIPSNPMMEMIITKGACSNQVGDGPLFGSMSMKMSFRRRNKTIHNK